MKRRVIKAADLFCGAGGTSTGLWRACQEMNAKLELLAVNHWNVAISTHQANHAYAKHLCESLDNVDPRKVVPGGRLNLLVASPECTHHSNARGGKPMSDQSRASAWHILRWAEALYIENILIENVREFRSWGPIGSDGRPLKSKRGETYQAFLTSLRSLGYTVEDRVLNAADYGDPTTRQRLFIMARRGGKKIVWPEQTHSPKTVEAELFEKLQPWRSAREIIDWSIPGESIFTRKRPLAPATLARIEAGLKKFGGKFAEPFLVILRNHGKAKSVDEPVPTLTAGGNHVGVCEPFVLGQQSGSTPRSTDKPLPTIATDGAIALVEPFLIPAGGPKLSPRSVSEPMNTVLTRDHMALVEPFLIGAGGPTGTGRPRSVNEPLKSVLTESHMGVVEPFIAELRNGKTANSIDDPLSTVTTKGAHHALVESFIMPVNHGKNDKRTHSMDAPMPAITTVDAWSMVEPFLVKYNGTAKTRPLDEPLDTVTTKDRFGLVETEHGQVKVDIRFRMLRPQELARAMSFDDSYKFSGNRELQVKQIGNAVPCRTAQALCHAILEG